MYCADGKVIKSFILKDSKGLLCIDKGLTIYRFSNIIKIVELKL